MQCAAKCDVFRAAQFLLVQFIQPIQWSKEVHCKIQKSIFRMQCYSGVHCVQSSSSAVQPCVLHCIQFSVQSDQGSRALQCGKEVQCEVRSEESSPPPHKQTSKVCRFSGEHNAGLLSCNCQLFSKAHCEQYIMHYVTILGSFSALCQLRLMTWCLDTWRGFIPNMAKIAQLRKMLKHKRG